MRIRTNKGKQGSPHDFLRNQTKHTQKNANILLGCRIHYKELKTHGVLPWFCHFNVRIGFHNGTCLARGCTRLARWRWGLVCNRHNAVYRTREQTHIHTNGLLGFLRRSMTIANTMTSTASTANTTARAVTELVSGLGDGQTSCQLPSEH